MAKRPPRPAPAPVAPSHGDGSPAHATVLLDESVEALVHKPDGLYVDGTYGRGGHSRAILERLGPAGRLIAIDRDPDAVADAQQGPRRIEDPRFSIVHAPFSELATVLEARGLPQIDGLLLDLGVSSPQIDTPERGFSFRFDGPLDMRMDPTRGESAADFLARAELREITEVIRDYGEERFAGPIARALVASRERGEPLQRTRQLATVVASAVRTREPGQDPATRTFQALRIRVNAELDELREALAAALAQLRAGGRLAVISFHSLEDRIVKTFIAGESRAVVDRRSPDYWAGGRGPALKLRAIGRIKPGAAELARNPRARSAVLRVAERLDGEAVA